MKIGTIGKENIEINFWSLFWLSLGLYILFAIINGIAGFFADAIRLAGG